MSTRAIPRTSKAPPATKRKPASRATKVIEEQAPVHEPSVAPPIAPSGRLASTASAIALGLLGAAIVVGLWQLAAALRSDLPGPADAFTQLVTLLSSPFENGGPNGRGIFLQLGASLGKVFAGFTIAAVIGVPIGFVLGASKRAWQAINPVVQLLRPVSPLAWFPIALVVLKDTGRAGVFTIAMTAIWPTLINTAVGVAGVPHDHRNVARVFRFSRSKYVRHVLLPYSMTSIVTGLRLSMGIAWMVIVATEMLSSGSGIGFFVWDSYNNNNLAAVMAAIAFIGTIGFFLDTGFARVARRFDYEVAA